MGAGGLLRTYIYLLTSKRLEQGSISLLEPSSLYGRGGSGGRLSFEERTRAIYGRKSGKKVCVRAPWSGGWLATRSVRDTGN